jgi:hypothetical protein
MTRRSRSTLVVVALSALAGCYGYYAPPSTMAVVGRRVQLSLSDSGSVMLASQLGPGSNAVEGQLVADSANRYLLSVVGVRRRDGAESEWKGEQVMIPHPFVTQVAERRFSLGRTALMSVITSGALLAAQQAFSGRGFGGGGGTSSGGGPK